MVKVAVDIVEEGLITREEALGRLDPAQLDQLLHPMIDPKADYEVVARGLNASPGAATGAIVFDADTAEERGRAGRGRRYSCGGRRAPDDFHGMVEAKGILTASGRPHLARRRRRARDGEAVRDGLRRALHQPRRARRRGSGAHELAEGDVITIDGGTGEVILGPVDLVPPQINAELRALARVGRRHPPAEGARKRRHACGRRQGARVRRPGDRALPHRAHVHGRGPAAARPGDDHGLGRGRAPRGTRQASCLSSRRTSRASSRPWPGSR